MNIQALISDIPETIAQELVKAQKSIFIVAPHFAHAPLLDILHQQAPKGVSVRILHSNDWDFFPLTETLALDTIKNALNGHSFCIVDEQTVIGGTYSWQDSPQENECAILIENDTELAKQFIDYFKYFYYSDTTDFPLRKITRRLEIVYHYIALQDNDVFQENKKLKAYCAKAEIQAITETIDKKKFPEAVRLINEFLHHTKEKDHELHALKLELRYLEHWLTAFELKKSFWEKHAYQFQQQHTQQLGELIIKALKLKEQLHQNDPETLAIIQQDQRNYQPIFEHYQEYQIVELAEPSPEQLQHMQEAFYQANLLGNPRIIHDNMRQLAQTMFIRLKKGYNSNDVQTVTEVLEELKQHKWQTCSQTATGKYQIKAIVQEFREQSTRLSQELLTIKANPAFQTIKQIVDCKSYFAELTEQFLNEIANLEAQIPR